MKPINTKKSPTKLKIIAKSFEQRASATQTEFKQQYSHVVLQVLSAGVVSCAFDSSFALDSYFALVSEFAPVSWFALVS